MPIESDRRPSGDALGSSFDRDTVDWERELETWPFRFARTMPHIPHWYVVRGKTVPEEEFDALERHIQENGFEGIWTSPSGHQKRNIYLVIGNWSYWVIENIINRDVAATSTVKPVEEGNSE